MRNVTNTATIFTFTDVYAAHKLTQEQQMLKRPTFMGKITKIVFAMSLKYTTVKQSILFFIFLVCIATIYH